MHLFQDHEGLGWVGTGTAAAQNENVKWWSRAEQKKNERERDTDTVQ